MTILNVEVWEDIPEWEGLYQASTYGRVRSLDRLNSSSARIKGVNLKPRWNRGGYGQVILCDGNRKKMITLHRLVALTFIPGNFDGAVINHKDEDKTNNRPENLEWCTTAHNNRHSKCKSYIVTFPDHSSMVIHNLRKFCREHNLHQGSMSNVASGKRIQHKGFKCRRWYGNS